jgi:hypothetical protein
MPSALARPPEPQWLLEAVDTEKGAARTFALKDIHSWTQFVGTTPEEEGSP